MLRLYFIFAHISNVNTEITDIKVLQESLLSVLAIPDNFYRVCLTGIFARVSIRRQ
ncbi:hypothetical protein [Nostoc commune]|uniref:hypothetical protein n=1 Tax=Nostoc commune TaxID=1178 RepID=UPI0020732D60|nr:hypothetical protein [Nostoc commune]